MWYLSDCQVAESATGAKAYECVYYMCPVRAFSMQVFHTTSKATNQTAGPLQGLAQHALSLP